MSIKLELDAASIKKAITTHISNQGFDLVGKTVEVALVNGRGGNGNRATVVIDDDIIIDGPPDKVGTDNVVKPRPPFNAPVSKTATEIVADNAQDIIEPTFHPEVEEVTVVDVDAVVRNTDNIMAAAESADPFADAGEESSLFPTVNPGDVETSKSLF